MDDRPILVIDAGTSALRCHLVDDSDNILLTVARPWSVSNEPASGELAVSFDTEVCWRSLLGALHRCFLSGAQPCAIAITSQRQSLVFMDDSGGSIYAGPNTDLRAVFQGAALDAEHGPLIHRTTGHRPSFLMAAGKIAWLRDAAPREYGRLSYVLPLADWLAYRLTGAAACEPTLAADSGLVDIHTRLWASELFTTLGLDCPKTPMHESNHPRGTVASDDIPEGSGIPVIVAGADTQCGLVGTEATGTGQAAVIAGWSATVQLLMSEPVLSPAMRTWTGLFQTPTQWVLESSAGDVGNAWRWLAETVFGGERDYDRMDTLAAAVPPGSDGINVYLGPRTMDVSAVGMKLGGMLFPTPMTLGGPTQGQICRAALESFAFAIRANIEQVERESGVSAISIAIGGGMTRSRTLTGMMPSVLGRTVATFPDHDSTVIGAARIARAAVGAQHLRSDPHRARVRTARFAEPDSTSVGEYEYYYQNWLDLQRSLDSTTV